MPRLTPELPREVVRDIRQLGDLLRRLRLGRRDSAGTGARRAGISRSTLYRVEAGEGGIALATYLAVMDSHGLRLRLDGLGDGGPVVPSGSVSEHPVRSKVVEDRSGVDRGVD